MLLQSSCQQISALILMSALAGQPPSVRLDDESKVAMRAALVLPAGFCKSTMKSRNGFKYSVGKAVCQEVDRALRPKVSSLTVVEESQEAKEVDAVLMPKVLQIDRTGGMTAFSKVNTVVLVEWTVKDAQGQAVWIETIKGNAEGHVGPAMTVKKNRDKDFENAVRDMADQAAVKISSAPEIRKLVKSTAAHND